MSIDIKEDPTSSSNGDIGGLYGVNIETLTGDKTLVPGTDPIYQYLNPDDADRTITLNIANATAGDRYIIKHNGDWSDVNKLIIKQGTQTQDEIYVGIFKAFIFDGTNWIDAWTGTGHGTQTSEQYRGLGIGRNAQVKECGTALGWNTNAVLDGVAIGNNADGHDYGVTIGYDSDGNTRGTAIGDSANANTKGVAVGFFADGHLYGTALGYYTNTNTKTHAIALGYLSKNTRDAELAINIGDPITDDMQYQYNQIIIGSWCRTTTNNTPTTMWVDGSSSSRFTIRPQSALIFKIMVTARDNTTGDCAAYLFEGLIKRDGSNNTTLSVCNVTVNNTDCYYMELF